VKGGAPSIGSMMFMKKQVGTNAQSASVNAAPSAYGPLPSIDSTRSK